VARGHPSYPWGGRRATQNLFFFLDNVVAIFFSSIFVSTASFGQQQDQINLIKSTQQQTKPDQPSNKQPKKILWPFSEGQICYREGWASLESQIAWWVGVAGVADRGRRRGGWQIWGGSRPPQSLREPPLGVA
jgi:hypothetical protein